VNVVNCEFIYILPSLLLLVSSKSYFPTYPTFTPSSTLSSLYPLQPRFPLFHKQVICSGQWAVVTR